MNMALASLFGWMCSDALTTTMGRSSRTGSAEKREKRRHMAQSRPDSLGDSTCCGPPLELFVAAR